MNTPLWTSAEVGRATNAQHIDDFAVHGISIDTRTLTDGDLFIALKGPNFDGHDYVETAIAAGAAGILSDRPLPVSHIQVEDTEQALTALGRAARDRFKGRLIAITGSVGKTTTRSLIAAAFGAFAKTHATTGNLNNHLGVPLTLARMPSDTEVAIIEMGMNHFGEIAALSVLARPTSAIITAIDWVHSENLDGTLASVAKAKAEIIKGLKGALYASHVLRGLLAPHLEGQEVTWIDEPYEGPLSLPGTANAWNAALALAAVPDSYRAAAAKGIEAVMPEPGRGNVSTLHIEDQDLTLIDEAYNASPASMMAAITNLADRRGGRKIAVVGDMAELANPLKHHENLGNFLAENPVDMVVAVGKFHQSILSQLPSTILSMGFDTPDGVVPYLLTQFQAGDVVLVKASNSTGLSHVVNELKTTASTVS